MEIMGSELIVEMRAAEALNVDDHVCTLEYIDGSETNDEDAYSAERHPEALRCGVCVKGSLPGGIALVEFPEKMSDRQSVLLYTLKKRRTQRILPPLWEGEKAK